MSQVLFGRMICGMRPDLPTGTVTFLFTDVEGSTRLLHELGAEGYAVALAEHRRVIREACVAEGGVEVDTQGDAFFFAFPTAPGALAAAGVFTEELARGPIRVRVGLHTGEPLLGEEGYVGEDVHFAARVAATSHGGQVVVSAETAALVEASGSEPQALPVVLLGSHRLKDVAEPVVIFQLGEGAFPPLKTIANSNLPTPASSFLGREHELFEADGLLRGTRLLTVSGPGGQGKTRFALELATRAREERFSDYADGVFSCFLSSLRDPALVLPTVAQTLSVSEQPGQSALDALSSQLQGKRMLLLLDNAEHLLEAASELAQLLEAASGLTLLVTSRELLRIRGETTYELPPLPEDEAVELFCERAQTEPSQPIRELCARLEGLPLALELAAARLRILTPEQLLDRLSQRLDLLKAGRDADPRQQTLRATIEWSYDLLLDEEQRLFRSLSVFAGGCTLQAAEEVCGADLDTLQSLVDKSLLRYTDERFWMLETIRGYAQERLEEAGEASGARRRHAVFFTRLAAEAEPALLGGREQARWLAGVDAEHRNVSAAVTWAVREDAPLGLELTGSIWRYWWYRAHLAEGYGHAVATLDADSGSDPKRRLKVLEAASYLAYRRGDTDEMRAWCEEALELARELSDRVAEGVFVNQLALIANAQGDRLQAQELFGESARLLDGDPYARYPLANVGLHALGDGDATRAAAIFEDVGALDRLVGDEHHLCGVEAWLALALSVAGRDEEERSHVRESLVLAAALEADEAAAMALLVLARIERERRPEHAAAALGSADGILERSGARRREMAPGLYGQLRGELEDRLGAEAFQRAYGHGHALSLKEALHAGLASLD